MCGWNSEVLLTKNILIQLFLLLECNMCYIFYFLNKNDSLYAKILTSRSVAMIFRVACINMNVF